jgi:hypothetical protein
MERVEIASCALCDWEFTHPETGACDAQLVNHLIEAHNIDPAEIVVEPGGDGETLLISR